MFKSKLIIQANNFNYKFNTEYLALVNAAAWSVIDYYKSALYFTIFKTTSISNKYY